MSKAVVRPDLVSTDLTSADRCDRCGAAAKVRVKLPPYGELLFCGHHARSHETKLRETLIRLA